MFGRVFQSEHLFLKIVHVRGLATFSSLEFRPNINGCQVEGCKDDKRPYTLCAANQPTNQGVTVLWLIVHKTKRGPLNITQTAATTTTEAASVWPVPLRVCWLAAWHSVFSCYCLARPLKQQAEPIYLTHVAKVSPACRSLSPPRS